MHVKLSSDDAVVLPTNTKLLQRKNIAQRQFGVGEKLAMLDGRRMLNRNLG